jgi:CRISPR-associated endonuclease/helicase Cas3
MTNIDNKILAKSSGLTLNDHSILVSRFAVAIAKDTLLDREDWLIEVIRKAALLHDIGKCTTSFQKRLKNDNNDDEKATYRHNEVGWAFLSRYLNLPSKELAIILDNVYWHHGISNKMSSYTDTDITINDKDVQTMLAYASNHIDSDKLSEKAYKPKKAPSYYLDDENNDESSFNNMYRLLTRSCLITADRLASSIPSNTISDEEIIDIININKLNLNENFKHVYEGTARFTQQVDIVSQCGKTTQINAPAGFGKTILGLLWSFTRKRKIIWVCPRNIVAESVYKSIIEELTNFNLTEVSVQLYLSGETKASNNASVNNNFNADIIVTNIDNYLSPSVNNKHGVRLHNIINTDVVFDEFHELIGETALFGCFINIMSTRHQLTNSNTLLLSATPTAMYELWDSHGSKTLILPNNNSHYSAPHQIKYKLNVVNEFNISSASNTLVIVNSVDNAQRLKHSLNTNLLLHSRFEDKDRERNTNKLYDDYGKQSIRNAIKPNVVGTHIVQASLDISFTHLYESVLSPQATLQRIGRCNRWGDIGNDTSINVVLYDTSGETTVRNILYTNNLTNMWFDYIKAYNGQEITLDDLYSLYNNFESTNNRILVRYLRDTYRNSLERLTNIYPIMFPSSKTSETKTAGGNRLRSSNNDLFVICRYHDNTGFSDPFSVQVRRNFNEEFNEGGDIENKLIRTMREIRDTNDNRYDYNEIINNAKYSNIDAIRQRAKKSNTPYIRYDRVYHPSYGEIKRDLLNELNNLN